MVRIIILLIDTILIADAVLGSIAATKCQRWHQRLLRMTVLLI